jgi:hypothetical protein
MATEPGDEESTGPRHIRVEPVEEPSQVVLFSPEVLAEARAMLNENPDVLVAASAPVPQHSDLRQSIGESVGTLVAFAGIEVGLWFFVRWVFHGIFSDGVAGWLTGGAAILGAVLFLTLAFGLSIDTKARAVARAHHGKYLLAEDWDGEATQLMRRAQRAVGTIQASEVNKRGLLDAAKNDVVLPEQLWDIGPVLQQLSALRARQKDIEGQLATAKLEAVLHPQRQALELSATAMETKVAKLEQYADQVREADAVLKTETILEDAIQNRDRYVELLSSTEAAGHSGLIDELSKETADLREALARRIAAALETGQTLALPAETQRPQDM